MPKISVSVLLMCMLSVRSNLLFERHYEIMTNLNSNNRKYTSEMKIVNYNLTFDANSCYEQMNCLRKLLCTLCA